MLDLLILVGSRAQATLHQELSIGERVVVRDYLHGPGERVVVRDYPHGPWREGSVRIEAFIAASICKPDHITLVLLHLEQRPTPPPPPP